MVFSPYLVPRVSLLMLLLVLAGGAWGVPRVEVTLEGISGELHDTVLANLSLQRERNHPLLSENRIERLHRRAREEIAVALRPFGYYGAKVTGDLEQEGELWRARYVVDPGDPVRVAAVEIVIEGPGAHDPELERWRAEFPLAGGDVLLDQVYEEAKEGLLRLARERGYLAGELVEHEVAVSAAERSARIRLRFDTGERVRFGEVSYSEVPLRESLLARYPAFAPGDPYDAEQLYKLHRDFTHSDYFERVEVVPRTDQVDAEGRVPVDVALEMRKRDRYTAGLGYGTDTGPRASLGYERRWLNSYGHRFSSEAVISDVRKGIVGNYRIPLQRPTTDFLGFTGSREREETPTAVSDTSTLGVNVTHEVDGWLRTVSLNYQEENFEVGDTNERSTMLYPSVAVQRVVADDRFFPTRGWRLLGEFRVASEDYWSASSLVQVRLGGKAVVPVLGGRFIPRFDVGAGYATNFDALPVSLRYFAGGDQSVRGFRYKSLGPVDADGDVEGGSNLLVGSAEYDYYFGKRFGMAVFTDVGNAFNSFDDYELHQGAGLGLRWRLPFGVIRVDVASAVSEEGKPVRLHLTIGPDL